MAWNFAAEIHALAGFNADEASTAGTSGQVNTLHVNQWLTDGAKEVIQLLSGDMKAKCSTVSIRNADNGTTLDMDGIGAVVHVVRLSADSGGYYIPCRRIEAKYADLANDSSSLEYFATLTDPVYYMASNSSDASTLFILPTPTNAQPAIVHHITYPTVTFNSTSIDNFPDEAEYLVVLYAAIKATEERMTNELINEDSELYGIYADKYAKLSSDYARGLAAIKGG